MFIENYDTTEIKKERNNNETNENIKENLSRKELEEQRLKEQGELRLRILKDLDALNNSIIDKKLDELKNNTINENQDGKENLILGSETQGNALKIDEKAESLTKKSKKNKKSVGERIWGKLFNNENEESDYIHGFETNIGNGNEKIKITGDYRNLKIQVFDGKQGKGEKEKKPLEINIFNFNLDPKKHEVSMEVSGNLREYPDFAKKFPNGLPRKTEKAPEINELLSRIEPIISNHKESQDGYKDKEDKQESQQVQEQKEDKEKIEINIKEINNLLNDNENLQGNIAKITNQDRIIDKNNPLYTITMIAVAIKYLEEGEKQEFCRNFGLQYLLDTGNVSINSDTKTILDGENVVEFDSNNLREFDDFVSNNLLQDNGELRNFRQYVEDNTILDGEQTLEQILGDPDLSGVDIKNNPETAEKHQNVDLGFQGKTKIDLNDRELFDPIEIFGKDITNDLEKLNNEVIASTDLKTLKPDQIKSKINNMIDINEKSEYISSLFSAILSDMKENPDEDTGNLMLCLMHKGATFDTNEIKLLSNIDCGREIYLQEYFNNPDTDKNILMKLIGKILEYTIS